MARVLLVDDSKVMLRMVEHVTRELFPQFDVVTATSGEAALEAAESILDDIEFALIDYNMPGINGIECADRLRAKRADLPIVICTANAQQAVSDRAAEHGLGVTHKPIQPDVLSAELEKLAKTSPESSAPLLTEDQVDVLKEAFNMGVGQAARSLTMLLSRGGEIELSVPAVELVTVGELASDIASPGEQVCSVVQPYHGPFGGKAYLIYSAEESLQLARYMLGTQTPIAQLSEMEGDALREIGNIVLNSCISTFGNMFGIEIATEVPSILSDTAVNVLTDFGARDIDSQVLYLRMDFNLSDGNLKGHLGFTMDVQALSALLEHVDKFLAAL